MQREFAVRLAEDLKVHPWGRGVGVGRLEALGLRRAVRPPGIGEAFRVSMAEGGALLDTAEVYGNGASERIICEILREENFDGTPVIATKFAPLPYRLSPRSLMSAVTGTWSASGSPRLTCTRAIPDTHRATRMRFRAAVGRTLRAGTSASRVFATPRQVEFPGISVIRERVPKSRSARRPAFGAGLGGVEHRAVRYGLPLLRSHT